ncbi:DUF4062 domain-containing protein [Sulfurimonas sp. SAG-AH-194-C21]|nr:ATP-binding protein [Sulfurimonas sp. SAG-AH-194-C21]MDF1884197.1 DUF4062 domain-containing protein [Sulfurimonas sp. SAG-AH-194-C21]
MQNRTFRLFISSPFSDFEKEREVLHKEVFPNVEEHCKINNITFQPIDLRWGVNEEAQLDQKTLEVCLEEVRACKHFPHPNFLIMAGDRYGYVPLPYMIEEDEFKNIIDVSDIEDIHLLNYWYKLDNNQIYTCDNNTESTAYILQPRSDEYREYSKWEKQEILVRTLLQKAANQIFLDKQNKEYQKYFLSATEQEVIEGICHFKEQTAFQKNCDTAVDKKYVFGYLRNIQDANNKYIDTNESLQLKADALKNSLQATLDKENIHRMNFNSVKDYEADYLEQFKEYITNKLIKSISEQIEKTQEVSKLEQELYEQEKFLKNKVKGFQGREKTLQDIQDYLKTETKEPLVIYGPSGMGKSSLMAKAIQNTTLENKIFRFVGATTNSTAIRNLLVSIINELQAKTVVVPVNKYEVDDNKFEIQVKEILSSVSKECIIFIDALDQLQQLNYLHWLSDKLPSQLKIIITVLNDEIYEKDSHYYRLLSSRYKTTKLIDISKDSLERNKEDLIINLLKFESRQLDEDQTNYLLQKWKESNYSPLYLKIAIEEVKHWKAGDTSEKLNDGVQGIIKEYLVNLTKLYHHESLLVKKVFGYIHVSKDGLSEQELLHILSEDLEDEDEFQKTIINKYHKPIRVKNSRRNNKEELILPISIWSRLHSQIKPFIITRNIDNQPLMKFFHRQFTSVIKDSYKEEVLHSKLASYFLTLQDKTKVWSERYHNLHMLDELPYQLLHSNNDEKLKKILFNLEFSGSIYNNHKEQSFRKIIEKATQVSGISNDEIYILESFYREKEYLIMRVDEKLWRPHQSLFQLAYEDGDDSLLSKQAEQLLKEHRVNFSWLKIQNRVEKYRRDDFIVFAGHTDKVLHVTKLNDDRVLSCSRDGSIRTWDLRGKQINILQLDSPIGYVTILNNNTVVYWIYNSETNFLCLIDEQGNEKILQKLKREEASSEILKLSNGGFLTYMNGHNNYNWTIKYAPSLWNQDGHSIQSLMEITTGDIYDAIEYKDYLLMTSFKTLLICDLKGELLGKVKIDYQENDVLSGTVELKNNKKLSYSYSGVVKKWKILGQILNSSCYQLKADKKLFKIEDNTFKYLTTQENKKTSKHTCYERNNDLFVNLYSYVDIMSRRMGQGDYKLKNGKNVHFLTGSEINYLVSELCNKHSSYGKEISLDGKGLFHDSQINGFLELSDSNILTFSDNDLKIWSDEGEELLNIYCPEIKNIIEIIHGVFAVVSKKSTIRFWNFAGDLINVVYLSNDSKNLNIFKDFETILLKKNEDCWKYQYMYSNSKLDLLLLKKDNIMI